VLALVDILVDYRVRVSRDTSESWSDGIEEYEVALMRSCFSLIR
jgi:hypothetical protein